MKTNQPRIPVTPVISREQEVSFKLEICNSTSSLHDKQFYKQVETSLILQIKEIKKIPTNSLHETSVTQSRTSTKNVF